MSAQSTLVLDDAWIAGALRRIAAEMIAHHLPSDGQTPFSLVGIYTRGPEMARRLADEIVALGAPRPAEGAIDVSMHRDDLRRRPRLTTMQATRLPLDLDGSTVVLVDDVFYTGRTVRAALDSLSRYGRPARIQLVALVDRGHRELPIRPDYVGGELPTNPGDHVRVRLAALDGEADAVWLDRAGDAH